MKYFGVKTWDEVLAQFDKGGRYADQWGWLEVLRDAHVGNKVAFSWSGGTDIIDPDITYQGTFTEDRNGHLQLRNAAGVTQDPAEVLRHESHTWYNLYQSTPGFSFGPYTLLRQYKADAQYTHLREVDWDKLLNVLEADHVAHFWVAPLTTGLLTIGFTALAVDLCTTGVGCVAAAELGVAAVSAGTSTLLLMNAASDHTVEWWRESTTWTPCGAREMLIVADAALTVVVLGVLFWFLKHRRISKHFAIGLSSLTWSISSGIAQVDLSGPSRLGLGLIEGAILGAICMWVVLHFYP